MTVGIILLMIRNVYISPVSPLIRSEAMFFFVNWDQYFPIKFYLANLQSVVSHIKSISVLAHNNSCSGNSQMLQFFK